MWNLYGPLPQSRDIYVLDPHTLEIITAIDRYQSFYIERSDYGVGTMSMTAELRGKGVEKIRNGDILSLGGNGARCGVVRKIEYEAGRGAKTLTFTGYSLKEYVRRRIIVPPTETEDPEALGWDRVIGTAEEVFRHYALRHLIAPVHPERAIPLLELDSLHDPPRGMQTPWQCELGEKLEDIFEEIGEWTKCGWDIRLDLPGKRMIFVINPGRDFSFGNTAGNDPIVFSPEHDNITVARYAESYDKYTNTPYLGGAGDDENRFVLTAYVNEDGEQVDEPYSGLERLEEFISAGNIDVPDELLFEGLHKHEVKRKKVRTIEAQVDARGIFPYCERWDVGDTATVQFDIGNRRVSTNERIVSVTEIYERGQVSLDVVFGQEAAKLTDRIRNIERRV